jgi:hypothetical protein
MVFDPDLIVHECADLSVGDQINAWQGDRLFHTGIITDLLPAKGLFWIREPALGERRLVDMSELQITRVPHPVPQEPSPQQPEKANGKGSTGGAAPTRSSVRLFRLII